MYVCVCVFVYTEYRRVVIESVVYREFEGPEHVNGVRAEATTGDYRPFLSFDAGLLTLALLPRKCVRQQKEVCETVSV